MPEETPLKGEREAAVKMLDEHCHRLMEHFDSVQIFVTRNEEARMDGTFLVNRGAGNWLCRYGQIREWLIFEEEKIRQAARPVAD